MAKVKRLLAIFIFAVSMLFSICSFTACNDNSVKLTLDNYTEYLFIICINAECVDIVGDWRYFNTDVQITSKSDDYKFKNCTITLDGVGKCKLDEFGNGILYGAKAHAYKTTVRKTLDNKVEKVSGKVIIS